MRLGKKIVSYRKATHLSQEGLAEKVYVTRQTISNWENDKSYPDIHSLLLLASLFQVSLDQLVEGDFEEMKAIIKKEEISQFNKDGLYMTLGSIVMAVTVYPLIRYMNWIGIGIIICEWLVIMHFALRLESVKKRYDVQTYRQIVALSKGETLDSIQEIQEKAKLPYQKPLIVIGFATIFSLIIVLVAILVNVFL